MELKAQRNPHLHESASLTQALYPCLSPDPIGCREELHHQRIESRAGLWEASLPTYLGVRKGFLGEIT